MVIRTVSYPASRTDLDADLWTRSSFAAGDETLHGRTPFSCSPLEEVASFRVEVPPPLFGHGLLIFTLDGGKYVTNGLVCQDKADRPDRGVPVETHEYEMGGGNLRGY